MAKKEEFYKRLKIAGMISFIPVILAAGPITGYFIGNCLEKKFGLSPYVTGIIIGIGFIASARETVKIIRLVLAIDKKP